MGVHFTTKFNKTYHKKAVFDFLNQAHADLDRKFLEITLVHASVCVCVCVCVSVCLSVCLCVHPKGINNPWRDMISQTIKLYGFSLLYDSCHQ